MFRSKPVEPVKALTPAAAARDAEALLILARNAAQLRALEDEAALAAEVRRANADQVRATLVQTAKATKSTQWAGVVQAWTARFVPFAPLVLVNSLAVLGQLGWGRTNLTQVGADADSPLRWVIAVLFAATLESMALFLAYYANRALNRGDSATSLYLGAFGMAAVVAGVNYSHYAGKDPVTILGADLPGPTAMGIVFALCSLASPWLWRIKHRDANRDRLHALGVIDSKAVKLSLARKIFYPVKSFRVTRLAVWDGETNPAEAVSRYEALVADKRAAAEAKALARQEAKAKALEEAPKAAKAPETTVTATVVPATPATVPAPRPAIVAPPAAPVAPPLPPEATRWAHAWDILHKTTTAGNPITQRQLAAVHLNKNRRHAVALITAYRQWKEMGKHVNNARTTTP